MADQFVGNIMFSIVNSLVSGISARNPDPIVRPIGGAAADASSRRRAWINEQIIRFILRERKFKEEVDMALLSAVLSPFGIVQHGYTPEVEFEDDNGTIITRFKNQTPDLPWIQFVRPWQVRIDPMVNSFAPDSEPRWVCFHKLYFASQIKKNENLIFRKDLHPTWFQDLRFHEDRDKGSGSQPLEGDRNVMPMYEEWVFYDADERRVFGISPGCDDLIREETEWPIEWGQLPFSYLSFNPQLDTPFGIPFPQMFYGEQLPLQQDLDDHQRDGEPRAAADRLPQGRLRRGRGSEPHKPRLHRGGCCDDRRPQRRHSRTPVRRDRRPASSA